MLAKLVSMCRVAAVASALIAGLGAVFLGIAAPASAAESVVVGSAQTAPFIVPIPVMPAPAMPAQASDSADEPGVLPDQRSGRVVVWSLGLAGAVLVGAGALVGGRRSQKA